MFIAAVALVAGFGGLEPLAIVLAIGLAYLLVVVLEVAISRAGAWPGQRAPQPADAPPEVAYAPALPEHQHVHVVPREQEGAAQPVLAARPAREAEPEPESDVPPARE